MSDDVTLPRREVETVLREHAFYKASAEKLEAARDAAALDLPALLAAARADAQDAATRAQAHSSDITAEEMAKAMHAGTNSVPWTSLTDGSWQQYRRLAEAALDYINARREEL